MLHLLFVLSAYVLPLTVHCVHVSLVAVTQFVHAFDQVVSLRSKLCKLTVHHLLLLPGFNLLVLQGL